MNPHEEMEGAEPPPPGVRTAAIVRWMLIGLATVAAVWSVANGFGLFDARAAAHAGDAAHAIYQCPMHPTITSDRPGECPICSMTLVRVDGAPATLGSSAVPGLAVVELADERTQRIGVRTARVVRKTISHPVRTVAVVAADERRLARVESRTSGILETVEAVTGAKVAKGAILATVFSRELLATQQEWLDAKRWNDAALAARARTRLLVFGVEEADLASIEASGVPLRAIPLRAPIAGSITARNAMVGSNIEPGTALFEIADLSRVWIQADVAERDLASAGAGVKADITFSALGNRVFHGSVTLLEAQLDPGTRTARARIELANSDGALRPGMYGEVELHTGSRETLVIPSEALIDTGERQYVFVALGAGRFEPRPVHVGASSEGERAVLDGLIEGEEVVSSGNFLLDSESRLRAAAERSIRAPARADIPIDRDRFPEKYRQWLDCERVHRGMGSMEDDCKNAIPKPWK